MSSSESDLSVAEVQAVRLSQAAIALGEILDANERSLHLLAGALDRNADVWLSLKSLVNLEGCLLSAEARSNIGRLADFVLGNIAKGAENLSEETLRTFVSINLQISEGLLEGETAR